MSRSEIAPAFRRTSMPGRNCVAWKAAVCALSVAASCGVAAAQGAPPPPAVSVTPVVSRQVTETIDYVGRLTAVDKVDIVARVPGFLEERKFKEGQYVKTGDLLFLIEQATYKAAVEQARATLAKAKATEVNAKLQLDRGKELVRNQNIPQSTLDQAEINLGYTEIRSPIDGRIGLEIFTKGNLVQPSSGRLATIVSQDPIYVTFQVSQRNLLDYFRRRAEDPGKNTHVNVRIKLPNGTIYPHAGMSDFLDQAGRYVLVVDAAKKVEQRRITTGAEQGRDIVVTDGLKEGEQVIVEGIQKVRPGQVVTATVVPGT